MGRHELFYAVLLLSSFVIGGNADGEGCNGEPHGISCCYNGFSAGDNDSGGKEMFIQADQYNIGCFETCKKLHPSSNGITVSVKQKYQSGNGTGRNKCWCEFGTPKLEAANENYKTCVFTIPGALALVRNDPANYYFSGSDCAWNDGYFFGHEGGRIKAVPKINVGEEFSITLSIKPQNLTGMLVGVRGPKDYLVLEIVDGEVVFRVENGKGVFMTSLKPNSHFSSPLDDGFFHEIIAIKSGNVVTMQVDKIFSKEGFGVPGIKNTDTNNPLFIGGHARPDLISSYPGTFQGCVKDVFINNKLDNSINNRLEVTSDMVYGDVTI